MSVLGLKGLSPIFSFLSYGNMYISIHAVYLSVCLRMTGAIDFYDIYGTLDISNKEMVINPLL